MNFEYLKNDKKSVENLVDFPAGQFERNSLIGFGCK